VLPHSSEANMWGKEVYFEVPIKDELEPNEKQVVEPGTVCFWTEGNSLALPYGPTPASINEECRLVARVNILGKLEGNPNLLASIQEGDAVKVEAL